MSSVKYLSTTAVAKQLGKEPRELFQLLSDYEWICKFDKRWQLTEKGRFEGGQIRQHPSYGDYIVWPDSLLRHPALDDLPKAPLTATDVGRKLQLEAKQINLLLAEHGLIQPAVKGWRLTPAGKEQGGCQQFSVKTGVPYVTWPEHIVALPTLAQAAELLRRPGVASGQNENNSAEQRDGTSALDGHSYPSLWLAHVASWLYLHRISFSYRRALIQSPNYRTDFYLPDYAVYIEVWEEPGGADAIQRRLDKQHIYDLHNLACIEIDVVQLQQVSDLDELLERRCIEYNIAAF